MRGLCRRGHRASRCARRQLDGPSQAHALSSPWPTRARPGAPPDWTVMERRVLIAIFLSFIVLYGYQAFIVKPVPKPAPGAAATTTGAKTAPPAPAALAGSAARAVAAPAPAAAALVGDSAE